MRRTVRGTICRHREWWVLRYRERIRDGETIRSIQRSKRLAPVDAMHKTRKSVALLAETILEPLNRASRASSPLIANRLGDFVDNVYLPHIESKRKPSTYRGYRQMWLRYLKPRCSSSFMHDIEPRGIQQLLDAVALQDGLAPQTMQHVKHFLGGVFTFALVQGHLARGSVNPVISCEIQTVPDFDGRAYSLEEIALMLTVLPEPSRTVVAFAAFTGLRAGELRGLTWEAYSPGGGTELGIVRVMHSIWRGRIGEPKNSRSKAPVPLIPQLETILEQHRRVSGNPVSGPIFVNNAGKGLDLDSLYRRQMREPLKHAGIEWEGWHGFRRGLATNLERIGIRESITAMILRHANDRVTRKHYIKPPTLEAISAMRRLSESFSLLQKPVLLPDCSPEHSKQNPDTATLKWIQ